MTDLKAFLKCAWKIEAESLYHPFSTSIIDPLKA